MNRLALPGACLLALISVTAAHAGDYAGPLVDAHSHLPGPEAVDLYVRAMERHDVRQVVLLGVGGVQKQDAAWLAAAARRHPARVIAGVPLPDPTGEGAAARLDRTLAAGGGRIVGEVHLYQSGRRPVDRDPGHPALGRVLEVLARRRVPMVVHYELSPERARALERALAAKPGARVILAHGGGGPPGLLEALLTRTPNLMADLSGMHFARTPALATETGPLDPAWKALIERMPERFLVGLDVWAPSLFEPRMLDRLMRWTRQTLGELPLPVAERIAYRNAASLLGLE